MAMEAPNNALATFALTCLFVRDGILSPLAYNSSRILVGVVIVVVVVVVVVVA